MTGLDATIARALSGYDAGDVLSFDHYQGHGVTLHHGDCLDVLRTLPDASVDSVVTDPPYGLEFMGKDWDAPWKASSVGRGVRVESERAAEMTERGKGHSTPGGPFLAARVDSTRVAGKPFQDWCEAWATECLRVLKPGGHLLAFGGTRTWHRLACAVEDAGFEVRDSIAWMYGSGFPKSLDVSKAIDKAAGAEREVVGSRSGGFGAGSITSRTVQAAMGYRPTGEAYPSDESGTIPLTAPATDAAREWEGWGTALKPAFEPVVVARKPLSGTVAANVLAHGTGALNIDGCRIESSDIPETGSGRSTTGNSMAGAPLLGREQRNITPAGGRWPANVVLDESQAGALDEQSGTLQSGANPTRRGSDKFREAYGDFKGQAECDPARGADAGGASRFFYVAKADATERPRVNGTAHPTVKPLSLMRWLVRLVTPPGGTVLEPFAGSGTTVEACIVEGFQCIAIEKGDEYLPLIMQRIHRRRDPVAAIRQTGDELGLFELDGEGA
jgi:DNA modification methylase